MSTFKRNEKQTVIDLHNRRTDDMIEKNQTQKQLLAIIEQKNTQLSVLSHVNTRLGAELSILQKKLGIDHDNILKELQETNEISAAFHFETQQLEYLDALLTAYDDNNIKQKKIIAHLYSSLEDAQKNSQNLVKDNQFLLGELQDKTKQILQIYSKGFVDENLTSSYSNYAFNKGKLQRQAELQIMENLRTQNEYVLNGYHLLQDKSQKLQSELREAKKKSDYHFDLYKKQSQDLKQAIIKIDDLIKIKDVLQKKFDEVTQQNIDLQTTKEQMETKITRLESQRNDYKNKFNLQRSLQNEQSTKVGRDFDTLKLDYEASQKKERELFNKNMLLEKDMQIMKDELKKERRQNEKIKADFEQTIKMCEAYESKVKINQKKELILRQNMEDNKEKLQATLLERDKSLLKQKQLQKLIDSIKDRNKQEMQALKNTFEKLIQQQNEKIRILQEDKEDSNSVFYQNECSLKHQIQKLRRDNQMYKDQNYRHVQNIKTNSGNQIISKLKQLQQKNQSLSRLITQKERNYREDIEHKEETIRNLQVDNRDIGRQIDRERASAREAQNQKAQYKSKISSLQKQIQYKEEEIIRLNRTIDTKSNANNSEKQQQILQLRQKNDELTSKLKETKTTTLKMLEEYNQNEHDMKVHYEGLIAHLQAQKTKLQKKLARV